VDIDSDIENYNTAECSDAVQDIKDYLYQEIGRGNFIQIQTFGGFHWLIRKSKLSDVGRKYRSDPIQAIIACMTSILVPRGVKINEMIRNKNEMMPLPGTVQYGSHIVTVLNKNDFGEPEKLHDWPEYNEYESP
jgi:nucleoid DNA-binding protein